MIFACAVTSVETEAQACLLAESIRANGGRFSESAVWVLAADDVYRLGEGARTALERLSVKTISFELDPIACGFPFAGKVLAAAEAERLAQDGADLLAWQDPDSIIIREPVALQLEAGQALGCRPVDHVLIGSPFDEPADRFWQAIYLACGVSDARLFPMTSSADEVTIRPYVNAGMLVARPKVGLLQRWQNRFLEALASGSFEPFFERDMLFRFFLHQAILAGVILSSLTEGQIEVLPHLVNYPLHMHRQYPARKRPERMNDLISGRYDTLFQDPAWPDLIPSEEPLSSWLAGQLAKYGIA